MSIDARTGVLTVDGQTVGPVAVPDTLEELRDAVRGDRSSILIAGNGSRMAFGNLGGPFDHAVSLRHLNRVLHYEPDDLTIAVEPGITLFELNAVLGERGQMLPIDDPLPHISTIGASFALGLSGPRRLGYGSLKDWVLGVEVMDPDGLVTKSGGMVVKNVTGYDLPRLHFGAHGAFGIVTRLNFKVFPRPEASQSIIATYDLASEAHHAGQALLASQLEPASVLVSNDQGWRLSVCCEGASASIARQTEDVVHVATSAAQPTDVQVSESETMALEPFVAVARLDGLSAVARLAVPPSGQVEVLERFQSMTNTMLCADLGSGLVYLTGLPIIEWREAIRESIQRPVFLSLPPHLKTRVDVFGGMDVLNARIVTTLKDSFDPQRRFNRGRFVLGL